MDIAASLLLAATSGLFLLALLMVGHYLADYPLQGEFLSRAKNHKAPIPGVPWYHALIAHASIHGGAVWLITGYWQLGLLETVCHAVIDHYKCAGKIGFNTDLALHLLCKVIWVALFFVFLFFQ